MGRHTELTGQGVPAVKLPRPYTYQGRHRKPEPTELSAERPPSPGYRFTLVEQPDGAS